jgi:hypothetical protein
VFQPEQAVGVLLHATLGDQVVGVLRSPVSPVRSSGSVSWERSACLCAEEAS